MARDKTFKVGLDFDSNADLTAKQLKALNATLRVLTKQIGLLAESNKEMADFQKTMAKVDGSGIKKVTDELDKLSETDVAGNLDKTTAALKKLDDELAEAERAIDGADQALDEASKTAAKSAKAYKDNASGVNQAAQAHKAATAPISMVETKLRGVLSTLKASGEGWSKMATSIGVHMAVFNQAFELMGKAFAFAGRAFDQTLGKFALFETGLVGVAKTTDLSEKEIDAFGKRMKDLSTELPISANELLKFGELAGQLGVKGAGNLENFAVTVAKVAKTTNLTGEQAAQAFAQILNVTNESISGVDNFASVVVQLGNNFATTEQSIVRSTNEIARGTAAFGVSSTDAAALATTLSSLGVQAELSGSTLSNSFATINKVIQGGGKDLTKFSKFIGMTGEQLKKEFADDAVGVFQKFAVAVKNSGANAALALEDFGLTGQGVNKVLVPLATRTDQLAKALKMAREESVKNTALNAEAAKAFKTLDSVMKKLSNTADALLTSIGAKLAPAFIILANALTGVLKVARFFVELPWEILAAASIPVITFAAALTQALIPALIAVAPGLTAMIGRLGQVGAQALIATVKMIPFIAKMTLLAVGVATLVTALDFLIRNIGRTGDVFQVFGKIVHTVWLNMGGIVKTLKGEFLFAMADMVLGAKGFAKGVGDAIAFAINGAAKLAEAFGKLDLASGLREAAGNMTPFIDEQFDEIAAAIRKGSASASKSAEFRFMKAGQVKGQIAEMTKTMDTGIAGKLIPMLDKLANGFEKSGDKAKKSGKTGATATEELTKSLDTAKVATEKLSEAQKQLQDVIKNNGELSKQIAEFGKSEIAVINMREAARSKELATLVKALDAEGKLTGGAKAAISLADQQQKQLNLLKIAQMRADAAQEFADLNAGLSKQITEMGKSEIALINSRTAARVKELQAIKAKLTAEGKTGGGAGPAIDTAIEQAGQLALLQTSEKRRAVEMDLVKQAQAAITANQNAGLIGVASINAKRDAQRQVLAEMLKQNIADGTATKATVQLINLLGKAANRAAEIEIKEMKVSSLKAVTSEVKSLQAEVDNISFFDWEIPILSALDAIEEVRVAEQEAIDAQEEKLKNEGLLTVEMQKQLDLKRGAVDDKASGNSTKAVIGGAADIAGGIADGFAAGVGMLKGAMDGLASLADPKAMIATFEALPGLVAEGMKNLPEIFKSFINSFLDALDQMVAALPQMISELLAMLPEMIDKIFASMMNLVDALPAIFAQLIEGLIPLMVQIMEKLPDMILGILDSIGDMAVILIQKIPEIVTKFAENIGPIIEALVEGLISNIGKIVIALIDTFLIKGGAVKIGLAIAKAMIISIPVAIVSGIYNGLKKVLEALMSGFKINLDVPPALKDLPKKIADEAGKVAAGVKASSSDVFSVMDLEKVKSAKSIDKSIGDATKRAIKTFQNGFKTIGGWLQQLWAALKAIWDTVIMWLQKLWAIIEQIWDVVVQALQVLWDVIEKIWDVVVQALQILWDAIEAIWDAVVLALQGLWDALEGIWDAVVLALQGLWDSLTAIFEKAKTMLTEGATAVWEQIKKIPGLFFEGIAKVWEIIQKIPGLYLDGANKVWDKISQIPGLFQDGANRLWSTVTQIPGKIAEAGSGLFNAVKSAFGNFGGVLKDHFSWAFDQLNPANLLQKMFKFDGGGKGTVENLLNIDVPFVSFAQGGVVPGNSPFPGDNKKNDTVAALLSPGEVVVPKSVLADPEIARLVQSIMEGSVQFAFGGMKSPVKISMPAAPKLPSVNDIKKLSPGDLIKSVEDNLAALSKLAFGDLWDLFKDKVTEMTKSGLTTMMSKAGSFDNGGVVPETGMGMLHQNEIVLPTNIVDKVMGNAGQGKAAQGGATNNITLNANISVSGTQGGQGAGKKIVDEMFKEIRKRSANQKIMFESGLIK